MIDPTTLNKRYVYVRDRGRIKLKSPVFYCPDKYPPGYEDLEFRLESYHNFVGWCVVTMRPDELSYKHPAGLIVTANSKESPCWVEIDCL